MASRSLGSIALSQAGCTALIGSLLWVAGCPSAAIAAPGGFWGDSYQPMEVYREAPPVRRVRPPVLPKGADKAEKMAAEGRKPQGPLVIAISIQRQQVKVYDANGLFAESPISSGMAGHSTPMGVFSIIQKHKFHRSNIYSGAPMPYMQRITWSGVAMHAGVLPGYPASHGCIRMPMSFAMKMWSWTRMGARVVVTPGEVSPADFAHPALAELIPPMPVAETPAVANVKTADASNSMTAGSPKIMADVATDGITAKPSSEADVATVASIAAAQAVSDLADTQIAANDGLPSISEPAALDLSDIDVPVGDALRPATGLAMQALDESTASTAKLAVNADTAMQASGQAAPPAIAPVEPPNPPTGSVAAPAIATPLIKRNLPVAIFVSRKDRKIYVRQNFTPLFDMPIAIDGDKALGTHVFTARPAKDEDRRLQWSVVSLPAVARQASRTGDDLGHRTRNAGAAAMATVAPGSPAEALARLTIPPELMTRLGDALPAGSSLVVSDQGIAQGETGDGTDFVVRLR